MKKPKRGRRRPADARLVLAQMKEAFDKKVKELGDAKEAARQLGVCPASFYNYLNGKTLPDTEVLRRASEKWGVKWEHMDFSEIMPRQKIRSVEQLSLKLLETISEEDVEIVKVGRTGERSLRIALTIRFSTRTA